MTTIEAAHDWLNTFNQNGSFLGPTVEKLVADMYEAVKAKDISLAWSLIVRLPKVCEGYGDPLEAAEARLECGYCILEMGDTKVAIDFFKDAASRYYSSPHHRGVALWMLGHALWRLRGHENEAILAWRKSINIFGSIQQESRFLSLEKKKWYRSRQEEMRETLKKEMLKRGITSDFQHQERRSGQLKNISNAQPQAVTRKVAISKSKTESGHMLPKGYLSSFPLIGNIPAGTPVGIYPGPDDEIEIQQLSINNNFYQVYDLRGMGGRIRVLKDSKYYILRVAGNSMDMAGIENGDYILLEQTNTAQHNDIVAALILGYDHQATLKRFVQWGDKIFLKPESTNTKHKEFQFDRLEGKCQIHGVARALLKSE